jgi:hypothetical protein
VLSVSAFLQGRDLKFADSLELCASKPVLLPSNCALKFSRVFRRLHLYSYLSMPSMVMPQNLKQQNDHLSPVNQARRLSVIRGPSHPPLMNITLGELTRRQSRKHANRVAIVSQHQNEVLSYSQLHKYSDDLAAGMISQGVERGDRVAVMLGNRSEYVHVRMSIYFYAPSNWQQRTLTLLFSCF